MIADYRVYDALYQQMNARGAEGWNDPATDREMEGYLDELIGHAGITNGETLELGCGTGALSIHLARRGFRAHGLDVSPTAIAIARERVARMGLAATFAVADLTEPYLALDRRFDLV